MRGTMKWVPLELFNLYYNEQTLCISLAWHLTLVYKKWPAKEPKLNDEGMTLATYCKTVPYNRVC